MKCTVCGGYLTAEGTCTKCSKSRVDTNKLDKKKTPSADATFMPENPLSGPQLMEYIESAVRKVFREEMETLTGRVRNLEVQNQTLQKNNHELLRRVHALELDVSALEQHTRKNNVIISGVPKQREEKTDLIVARCVEALGVKLQLTDIDISHRLPERRVADGTPTPPPSIVARFVSRNLKNSILTAMKKKGRGLSLSDLGFEGNKNRIYINQHLSPKQAHLLRQAKIAKEKLNYEYVWVTNDGKIMMRKTSNSTARAITCLEDLQALPPVTAVIENKDLRRAGQRHEENARTI